MHDKQYWIEQLCLKPHVEGGFFRRTFGSELSVPTQYGNRISMSSIFYMLTDDSSTGYFHKNRSDIMHYWHAGSPLHYTVIHSDGGISRHILGPDIAAGQQLQLLVEGGAWKATQLKDGQFGLLSEAVTPGYESADMQMARFEDISPYASGANKAIMSLVKPA